MSHESTAVRYTADGSESRNGRTAKEWGEILGLDTSTIRTFIKAGKEIVPESEEWRINDYLKRKESQSQRARLWNIAFFCGAKRAMTR